MHARMAACARWISASCTTCTRFQSNRLPTCVCAHVCVRATMCDVCVCTCACVQVVEEMARGASEEVALYGSGFVFDEDHDEFSQEYSRTSEAGAG